MESNSQNIDDLGPEVAAASHLLGRLTKREREVLYWIVEGKTNSGIGEILNISPRTVEKHCEGIFRKLGIENRYTAIVLALTNSWDLQPVH